MINGRKRILLLEDEISHQRLMHFILSKQYHLDVVENGLDAMNWLKKNERPDLIIMDWIMPVMDGKNFLNAFKYEETYRSIPVIVLSSYDLIHEELVAISFEAHSKLSKPVNPTLLKDTIAGIIVN